MSLLEKFVAEFKPKLTSESLIAGKQFERWPAFEFIAKELLSRNKSLQIIETGTLNSTSDWLGYGQATLLWNWLAKQTNGLAASVDIDPKKCEFAKFHCPNVHIIHADSISFLRQAKLVAGLDLLYLDAFDWSPELHVSSSLHHMGELAAIYDKLPSGCLICVDDCHSDTQGKHTLVRDFFKNMLGLEPLVKCHIQVWRKP